MRIEISNRRPTRGTCEEDRRTTLGRQVGLCSSRRHQRGFSCTKGRGINEDIRDHLQLYSPTHRQERLPRDFGASDVATGIRLGRGRRIEEDCAEDPTVIPNSAHQAGTEYPCSCGRKPAGLREVLQYHQEHYPERYGRLPPRFAPVSGHAQVRRDGMRTMHLIIDDEIIFRASQFHL